MVELSPLVMGILIILTISCFAKVATALSIVRFGLGLNGAAFGIVIIALSLVLSFFIMSPELDKMGGASSLIQEKNDSKKIETVFTPFLEKYADSNTTQRLQNTLNQIKETRKVQVSEDISFSTLVASFLLTELKTAFLLGFLFIVPFLVIDLIVTNILMSLNIVQIPANVIALPLKVIFFVLVDGWNMISDKLIGTYL